MDVKKAFAIRDAELKTELHRFISKQIQIAYARDVQDKAQLERNLVTSIDDIFARCTYKLYSRILGNFEKRNKEALDGRRDAPKE